MAILFDLSICGEVWSISSEVTGAQSGSGSWATLLLTCELCPCAPSIIQWRAMSLSACSTGSSHMGVFPTKKHHHSFHQDGHGDRCTSELTLLWRTWYWGITAFISSVAGSSDTSGQNVVCKLLGICCPCFQCSIILVCVENILATTLETLRKLIFCACPVMPEDFKTKMCFFFYVLQSLLSLTFFTSYFVFFLFPFVPSIYESWSFILNHPLTIYIPSFPPISSF